MVKNTWVKELNEKEEDLNKKSEDLDKKSAYLSKEKEALNKDKIIIVKNLMKAGFKEVEIAKMINMSLDDIKKIKNS